MDWVDKPQNYKDLYGILQLLRGSHLQNFRLKTLKLGWVTFHSVTFQLKWLDFLCNQYQKLVPVPSRFCNFHLGFMMLLSNGGLTHNDSVQLSHRLHVISIRVQHMVQVAVSSTAM